jgi:4-nitrophenyl phosphatase/NagD protein
LISNRRAKAADAPIVALLLDMDGVLFHGDRPLAGAREFLEQIAQLPHLFVTNNPIRTPAEVSARLAALGLCRPPPQQILTSAEATARWLARRRPAFHYFAVGAAGLDAALSEYGESDAEHADFVVVGEGPGLDFESLTTGINLILKHGARLIVTNPDTTVDDNRDGEHRVLPGGGALVAPFVAACGVSPIVIGKPEPALFEMACERLGVPAAHCVMVGDRPDTDIAGAIHAGMRAALVRTGRFAPGASWPSNIPMPQWDVPDLPALLQAWDGLVPTA